MTRTFVGTALCPYAVAVDESHIYWTDQNGVGRANLDGTGVQEAFIPGPAAALAVGDAHVYFTTNRYGTGSIARANLDGSGLNPNFITGVYQAYALAVDASHVYWNTPGFGNGSIGRASIDGSGADSNFITNIRSIGGLAVDATHLYWSTDTSLARANLDGSGVQANFISGLSSVYYAGVAGGVGVNSSYIYWARPGMIGRANLDGSDVRQNFVPTTDVTGHISWFAASLAIDGLPSDSSRPTITIRSPDSGAHYERTSKVTAVFACSDPDGPQDVASCAGTTANGQPIDTSTLGSHSFTVTAVDRAGNRASETVNYSVRPRGPLEFIERGRDRIFGITVCPDGYAVEGLHVAKGLLLCRAFGLGKPDVFADYSTQRSGMHACPDGTYVRGYDDARNILVCSFDIGNGSTTFASGDLLSPTGGARPPQRFGMHVCSNSHLDEVVVGVHAGRNVFLCRRIALRQPTPAISLPAAFDPARARGFREAGLGIGAWRSVTLNWLTHILNLPMPGTAGDPRCVRLTRSFASLDSRFGVSSPTANCSPGSPALTIHVTGLAPPPSKVHCDSGHSTLDDSAGFGPGGVQQLILSYQSPVLPRLTERAYLTLPPGYRPDQRYPVVVLTHGHVPDSKESMARCPGDQDHANALALAQAGAITLAPDTITFGQYKTGETSLAAQINCPPRFTVDRANCEATYVLRVGTLMHRFLLDNIGRLSIVSLVPGADISRLYVAGLSLGGWQALWTAALDARVHRVVAAGIYEALYHMETATQNRGDQEVPSISTFFLHDVPIVPVPRASMLIQTPDLAALIFGHAALMDTWGPTDPGAKYVDQTIEGTRRIAELTGGQYVDLKVHRNISNEHEWYSYLPLPGKRLRFDRDHGSIPFLLNGSA